MALNEGLVNGQRGPHLLATRASLQRYEEDDAYVPTARPKQLIDNQQDTKPSEISEFPSRLLFADRRANLSRAFVKIIPIAQYEIFSRDSEKKTAKNLVIRNKVFTFAK